MTNSERQQAVKILKHLAGEVIELAGALEASDSALSRAEALDIVGLVAKMVHLVNPSGAGAGDWTALQLITRRRAHLLIEMGSLNNVLGRMIAEQTDALASLPPDHLPPPGTEAT